MAKPLVFSDSRPAEERFDPERTSRWGPSYIPGYSEIVAANDIAKADDLLFREQHKNALRPNGKQGLTKDDVFRQLGTGPRVLDHEFRWLRVSGPNMSRTYSADAQLSYAVNDQGFRLATEDDLKSRGYGMPPAAHLDGEGKIRRLDVALYIRSGEVARKWERYEVEKAAKRENSTVPTTFTTGDYTVPASSEVEKRETITLTTAT